MTINVRLGFILGVVFIPENNKLMAEFTSRCSISKLFTIVIACRVVVFATPFLIVFVIMSPLSSHRRRLRLRCYFTVACPLVRCLVPVSFRSSLLCRRCSSSCLSSSSQRHRALCRYVAVACSRRSVVVALSSSLVVLFMLVAFVARRSIVVDFVARCRCFSSSSSLIVFVAMWSPPLSRRLLQSLTWHHCLLEWGVIDPLVLLVLLVRQHTMYWRDDSFDSKDLNFSSKSWC